MSVNIRLVTYALSNEAQPLRSLRLGVNRGTQEKKLCNKIKAAFCCKINEWLNKMSGISSIISTRPDWTRSIVGIPFDVVVRISGSTATKANIVTSRNKVSLVKGDSGAAKPEDEYDVNFVYGADASNMDIAKRHIEPLVRKALEGYNVCVFAFGATGSGKTLTIEGSRARDSKTSSEGDGLVHHGINVLYKLLNDKAVAVGERVAHQRRMPGAKAYDFFVESSFVEVYNESCHDLYQKGDAVQANLPIYEDENEGYQISSLTYRMAKTDQEMRASFNYGRLMRDMQKSDVGSTHERSAALFSIHLAQYSPAAAMGQEDSVLVNEIRVSKIMFVDMPGSERLAMDPELLRLREGQVLNKGLLSFASTLATLARDGSPQFVNYDDSILVKLLSEPLGGNCMSMMIGNLRQGSTPQLWQESSVTLQHLMQAKRARSYPIINHGRARGLIQMIRRRMLAILEDRETLREQLNEVPADGDPNAMAISIARVRDLEARVNAEREEKASINQEKQALQARLSKLRDAETGDLQERAELQDALIKSEEMRLALARTLVDAQMDANEKEGEWAAEKLELEKRIAELEAGNVETYVKADDHAGLLQQRDELNTHLLDTQDELSRRQAEIEELKNEVETQQESIRKLNQELNLIGGGSVGDGMMDYMGDDIEGDSIEAKRRRLFMQLKLKNREVLELQSAMKEQQKDMDKIRNKKAITKAGVDEIREAYRRKLETNMRDIADMSRAVAIMQDDPSTGLKVSPEDLFNTFQRLTDENMKITEDREKEMRQDLDELHGRHVEMKRKFRTLYLAYRQLRYLIEDKWPQNGIPPQPQVSTEDQVLGSTFEEISRSEEEADRRLILRLRERTSHLDSQLRALRLAGAAGEKGIHLRPTNLSQLTREQQGEAEKYVDVPEMVKFENEKLREELDRLKRVLGPGPQGANEKLLKENSLLISQIKALNSDKNRAQLALEIAQLKDENENLRKGGGNQSMKEAVKDFSNKTQAELERKLANAEARKVMAEEQLESMQKYLTQATVQYQREIVRLRSIIGQLDPRMLKTNPLQGT
ncbi:hypothetical protein CEUSTIGMA_g6549.t1 [Chlamydomonas eustigma]|uniref:Kinesin motor domain-containing protein n=1 Tax=Chlamydomonas eustigma TaxID=1157962 RepID=A0A250X855_9CHLO|nr:hypothetical protein CEUSTIGMA_g6549.t1 [Chlamydomonas eustigma]|eukprot:GAX79109.1 hypothetical protein CEUSTIGMA_g6549.t1 [Chlamydomonas eustigma]